MKKNIVLVILVVMCVALYALTLRGVAGNPAVSQVKGNLDQATKPLELSPERGRYLLTMSLAEHGSFALPQAYADAAYPDVGYYQGRFYVYFAPGMSLFALPFYYIGKYFGYSQVGAFSVSTVFALLNLLVLYRIGKDIFKFSTAGSLIAPIIFGFASTSWSYAITLYQHHASTFYMLSAFYAVFKYAQKGSASWAWALYVWFVYGCAILIDYPNALLLLPVMIYFLVVSIKINLHPSRIEILPRWSAIATSIVFVVIMLAHGYYNLVNFGGWTKLSGGLIGYKAIIEKQLLTDPDKSAEFTRLEQAKDPVRFFQEYNFPFGLYTLSIASDRGLFVYYPIYIVAFLGIWIAIKQQYTFHKVLISLILVNLFLYASFGDPWGGWAFGSRYLIPSMAILALYVALWLKTTRFQLLSRVTVFVLFLYSSAIALVGALTTNAVPPQVEADYLKTKHNFLLNFDYLFENRSSSVLFNQYFTHSMTLQTYYFGILITLALAFMVVLIWSRGVHNEK